MSDKPDRTSVFATSRRRFLVGSVLTGTVPLLPHNASSQTTEAVTPADIHAPITIDLRVNERAHRVAVDVRTTLLDALREHIGLTGAKKGCDHGQCGACTVLIEGRRELACLTLAVSLGDRDVTTIEGLAEPDGDLHPMQQAFVDHDAFQCGYCTAGQILSAIGCVHEGHAGSTDEIRESMSGNICRCAAYPNIVAAVAQARDAMGS